MCLSRNINDVFTYAVLIASYNTRTAGILSSNRPSKQASQVISTRTDTSTRHRLRNRQLKFLLFPQRPASHASEKLVFYPLYMER